MSPDLDAKTFAALAAELHEATDVQVTAEQVVDHALAELDATYGGITLLTPGPRLETVAPSSPIVSDLDGLQTELGEGICFESDWPGELLSSENLIGDHRWPAWAPKAAALGIASFLAVELAAVDGRRIGALNLYWTSPRRFTAEDVAFAQIFAQHAAVALSNVITRDQLRVALDARKRIGQAQGMLMERFGLDEQQAFLLLRRYSQDHNIKLRVIADRLVETGLLPVDRRHGKPS